MADLPITPIGITIIKQNGILFVRYKRGSEPITKLFKTMIGAQRHIASLEAARALRVIATPQD